MATKKELAKSIISKELLPFLDKLTDEELVVFKGMVKRMRNAIDTDSPEAISITKTSA